MLLVTLQLHNSTFCEHLQQYFGTAIRKNLPAVVSQTDFSPICHQNALARVWNWLAQKLGQ
jgi:NAD-dependent oxidoreductase involved in siderophore biosynthesis